MAEAFDIERFMENSGKVDLSDIPWEDVPKVRLKPEALRTLRYFLVTESSTFFYAKALMSTRAMSEEPDFAAFMSAWIYEEEFHGRAFKKFMECYGEDVTAGYRTKAFQGRTIGERIDEAGQSALSAVFGDNWPATHMAWGAIQELTTYHAYQALMRRVDHPVLTQICQRIAKQELRHFAFYYQQAQKRLENSPVAQRLASTALKLAWTPVGDGMCAREDTLHLISFLFDGVDGDRIGTIERKIRGLPGLEWFDLFTKYATKNNVRRAPAAWLSTPRASTPASEMVA